MTPQRKDRIDLTGAFWLVMFAGLMGINQVLVKLVNDGMSPLFQAAARSYCALVVVLVFALAMRKRLSISDGTLLPGVLCGALFAAEFMLTFVAFEYTTVARVTMLFYTMPFWLALIAHFVIPGERMTLMRFTGLMLAVAGIAWVLLHNDHPATEYALWGDIMCLIAAVCWAGIALTVRLTKLSTATPEMQLVYQLGVSAIIMAPFAFAAGGIIRDFTSATAMMFAFQVLAVASFGFLMWFRVLAIYPASDMASFGFLTPLFGVAFGWLILDEVITWDFAGALALVCAGIVLVNRKRKVKVVEV